MRGFAAAADPTAGAKPVEDAEKAASEEPPPEAAEAEAEAEDSEPVPKQILRNALAYVSESGWSNETLRAGAADAGLSPASVGLFPRGPVELVEFHIKECNRAFAVELREKAEELKQMRMRERITWAVRRRLELIEPVIASWPHALKLQASPSSVPRAFELRAELVDEIWHVLGDTSSDVDWYAKRMALAAVYASTEVAMLTDFSPGFAETWAFLDRRVDDMFRAGKAAEEAGQTAGALLESVVNQIGRRP